MCSALVNIRLQCPHATSAFAQVVRETVERCHCKMRSVIPRHRVSGEVRFAPVDGDTVAYKNARPLCTVLSHVT